MKRIKNILSVILCCALTSGAHAANCNNKEYRSENPEKCSFYIGSTGATLLGGAALFGGAFALIGMISSNAEGDTTNSFAASATSQSLTITYASAKSVIGADVSESDLASITSANDYIINQAQYDAIYLSYSLARGYTGAGSTIAVFDGGLDSWHGKTVAGFAGGTIAPDANVISYDITDDNLAFLSYSEIGDAIYAATSDGANIYNFSWNASSASATSLQSVDQLINLTDENFVSSLYNAAANDAIFVWAAGNEGNSESGLLSALPLVISELDGLFINVVAWDSETNSLASFSNACGITQNYCITAPGTDLSTGGIVTANGTSFATPIVSAAIAVISEAWPYLTSSEIVEILFVTAQDLGAEGIDEIYGNGMLDLEAATRPVGTAVIPIDNGTTQVLETAQVSGAIAESIISADLQFAYFDDYGREFTADLNDNISIKNQGRAFARLQGSDQASTQVGNIEFGVYNSDLMFGDGFLKTDDNNQVTFIGTHNDFSINDNFNLFQTTRLGMAMPEVSTNSFINSFSNIYTASLMVGATFKDFSVSFGIPETIIDGEMKLRLPSGRADSGEYIYSDYEIDMVSSPAMEYSFSYKNITASFIDNPYGTDEFFIMTRGKLSF